jgi:hypothetical protein
VVAVVMVGLYVCLQIRAAIEAQCTEVCLGKATKTDVVARALAIFEEKFRCVA